MTDPSASSGQALERRQLAALNWVWRCAWNFAGMTFQANIRHGHGLLIMTGRVVDGILVLKTRRCK